ncbi:MAG: hypothetical protein JWO13_3802 [Acidobacteriales bacterium]|nr:hypothetical protein [Terriglobales bacterium]MEA2618015.1 hypothetical protein [Chloroflexota bacterium]
MTEVSIRTRGRAHVRAEFVAPDDVDDQLALAAMAVDALFALGEGLFEPLSVDTELACCDAETGYPLDQPRAAAPFHQLRLVSLPETVVIREVWNGTRVEQRERLDRDQILDWLRAILAEQECPQPDTIPGWRQLLVETVRARLPEGTSDGDELPVTYGAGMIRYPVERAADALWVAGPLATHHDTAPFEVRIVNEAGVLSLDLSLNWSLWIDTDGAGRPDIEAAVGRLSALGWDVASADPA